MKKKIKAVIMAGGFGTRIQPLTYSLPKPMLPIVNIPMMEHVLKKLKATGIDEVVILLYYMPHVIKNHFEDGSKWGVKIHYVLPDGDYGTAGAVGFAREFLDTTFMIVSGDLVTDFDFTNILDYHFRKRSTLTITLTSVENPLQFGVVIVNEEGEIEKFLEKPSWGEVFSDTINTGIYVIEPQVLDFIPKEEQFDFAKDLFPLLMEKGITLYGYTARGYWRDVGNPDSYREVHDDILHEHLDFPLPGKKIDYPEGMLHLMGKAEIPKDVEIIDNVVVDEGVTIGKGVRLHNVVIGKNTTVGAHTKLRNCIIWHDVQIGRKCFFDNAVICNEVKIGDMVEAKAGAIIAEGTRIGKLAKIEQDVTIWPNKEIEPAAIVTNNVIWGTKYKNALFSHGIITGKSNIEISCEVACRIGEAFGSQLPKGSFVAIGRDYEEAPRMLKRAFAGGLLSTGINIVDLKAIPPSVLRFNIGQDPKMSGGAYFRQSYLDPSDVEIILFDETGLRLHIDLAKKVEKAFFKEEFRRTDYKAIGGLEDNVIFYDEAMERYMERIKETIDHKIIKGAEFRVAVDLMHGIAKDIYPTILTELQIENITLNAYYNKLKLANTHHLEKESKHDLAKIVPSLQLNAGFLVYPHGQRLTIISDDGHILDKVEALVIILTLMEMDAKAKGTKYRVFLPSWAPDMMDEKFERLMIKRGRYHNFKASTFSKFDLIATVDGNFAFTEFAFHRDAIFASLKIMELLSAYDIKLSQIEKETTHFSYHICKVPCPQSKKGKIMRKFIKYAKNKKHSTLEGVKIWEDDTDWILMIPDQYSEHLNLYIQAKDQESCWNIHDKYRKLIEEWLG